jgi:hypothetical protein
VSKKARGGKKIRKEKGEQRERLSHIMGSLANRNSLISRFLVPILNDLDNFSYISTFTFGRA